MHAVSSSAIKVLKSVNIEICENHEWLINIIYGLLSERGTHRGEKYDIKFKI